MEELQWYLIRAEQKGSKRKKKKMLGIENVLFAELFLQTFPSTIFLFIKLNSVFHSWNLFLFSHFYNTITYRPLCLLMQNPLWEENLSNKNIFMKYLRHLFKDLVSLFILRYIDETSLVNTHPKKKKYQRNYKFTISSSYKIFN